MSSNLLAAISKVSLSIFEPPRATFSLLNLQVAEDVGDIPKTCHRRLV